MSIDKTCINSISSINFINHGGYNSLKKIIKFNLHYYIFELDNESNCATSISSVPIKLSSIIDDKIINFGVSSDAPSFDNVCLSVSDINNSIDRYLFDKFLFDKYKSKDYIVGYRIDNLGLDMKFICGVKYKKIPCFDILYVSGKYQNK